MVRVIGWLRKVTAAQAAWCMIVLGVYLLSGSVGLSILAGGLLVGLNLVIEDCTCY